ncbi:MAG: 4Fe-4S dicluster domain-containing protein [Bacteroidia bacterium]|nr:MAG: 4Fe-4S dicluster domain-containing protein [Bacteroidia bacterium]
MEKQWRSIEEYKYGRNREEERGTEALHKNALLDVLDSKVVDASGSRRDFLKLFGFSVASAAVVSSCEKPVQKAIPYLIKPEEIIPGKANYYASTFFDGTEYCSVLVKVRDGRPIKIEGNHQSPVSRGGTSARVQASVLNLYDDARLKEPVLSGNVISWEDVDRWVINKLGEGGHTVLVTPTNISPSTSEVLRNFIQVYPNTQWIQYDEVSASGIRDAHFDLFGAGVIPGFHFDRAEYILSFDADFLGTWIAPVEFARDYASTREVTTAHPHMSKHIQVESALSMTGSNADERIPVTPQESALILGYIYNAVAAASGFPFISVPPSVISADRFVTDLLENREKSLVVSGSNDPEIQKLVAGINYMLGNYNTTLDLKKTIQLKRGSDQEFQEFIVSLEQGEVDNLILANVNPVYSLGGFEAMKKAGFTAYIGSAQNETSQACQLICPDHHFLEAWGDAEPVRGSYSLQQPCIHPLFNSRAFQDSLLKGAKKERTYDELIRFWWENVIAPREAESNENWWERTLQAGFFNSGQEPMAASESYSAPEVVLNPVESDLVLTLYTSVGLNDGRYANNPWLQELPDPVSKVCWDNYLSVSLADADKLGLEDEGVVSMDGIEVPVLIQPGQAKGTVSLALGYGRTKAGKVGDKLGVNAFRWVIGMDGYRAYTNDRIKMEVTGKTYPLARTQTHHTMEGRPIVRETTLEEFREDPSAGNEFHLETEAHHQTLYPEAKFDGYHWGMVVDQNKCTGCNNCVVSCIAENNIAVVGKEEVKKRRIMHWMRIDRYFSDHPDNPKVFHQPLMCQHCDNAPCENVCPVSATMHSNEGLNQVAYVRCIGTKYCINNCPYRVRRFNWYKYIKNDKFDFNQNSDLSRLVLNPDVTVRERGVVEKCTLCVQRIQEKKLEAKLEGRVLKDGEIQPACVQSCPSGALVFGNMNDPESKVSKLKMQERNYYLLEQLHTLPSVGYLTKVRNTEAEPGKSPDSRTAEPAGEEQHG